MKHLLIIFIYSFFSIGCTSQTKNELQEALREKLETKNGVRSDFKIKFSKTEIVDILVKDSIAYYQNKFSEEKKKKASNLEHQVKLYQKSVTELEEKPNPDIVDQMLLSDQKGLLKTSTEALQSLDNWKPEYLNLYKNLDENTVLAKLVTASFTFTNPYTKVNQEVKDGKFLFSADGKQCHRMIE